MLRLPQKEPLNLVPFIDVMLVLLVMVLSVSTFIASGQIPVSLPRSSAAQPAGTPPPELSVTVDSSGNWFVNAQASDVSGFRQALKGFDRSGVVQLGLDARAPFEQFIEVMDILKEFGHENFRLLARQKP